MGPRSLEDLELLDAGHACDRRGHSLLRNTPRQRDLGRFHCVPCGHFVQRAEDAVEDVERTLLVEQGAAEHAAAGHEGGNLDPGPAQPPLAGIGYARRRGVVLARVAADEPRRSGRDGAGQEFTSFVVSTSTASAITLGWPASRRRACPISRSSTIRRPRPNL